MDRGILQKWLKAGFMEKHALYRTEDGTPQGDHLPVLANLALDGLAALLKEHFPRRKDGSSHMVNLARYADDFVITGDSQELLEAAVKPLVERFMRERGLELSQEKTVITRVEDGFDFLGQTVRKYPNGKVLTSPSKQNVKAFLRKVRGSSRTTKRWMPVTWSCCSTPSSTDGRGTMPSGPANRRSTPWTMRSTRSCGGGSNGDTQEKPDVEEGQVLPATRP
jgi:RNA-directed DNA polymerase